MIARKVLDDLSILWRKGKEEQIKRNEGVQRRLGWLEVRNVPSRKADFAGPGLAVAKDRSPPGQAGPVDSAKRCSLYVLLDTFY